MIRALAILGGAVLAFSSAGASEPMARRVDVDLLVVGGNEAAVAAAVQASRLGVKRVLLVSDTQWLGGQFSSQGVGAVDEWTTVNGERTEFPRSGMFLEVVRAIEAANKTKYGLAHPGNCFCARLTIEPAEAARIFDDLVRPEVKTGRLTIERGWEPSATRVKDNRLVGVTFVKGEDRLEVTATLTIDAGDWGDVIRLSGTKYSAGPDLKSRFNEPSAPTMLNDGNRREMNPLTYCVVLRGAKEENIVAKPVEFEPRNYFGVSRETQKRFDAVGWKKGVLMMNVPAFVDTTHKAGPYSPPVNVYTHRRLVDAVHLGRPFTDECLFLNWPVQDYPLDVWPQRVADALDKTEAGASKKNIVDLTIAQRRIVLEDAKAHSLSMLHHLQTIEPAFRKLRLSDEFGTTDRLPPTPYIREGLRLEALMMLSETDLRTEHPEPRWAKTMPKDGLFGFQFNIDFHPTRRQFLNDDPAGPWATIHTATRNWSTHTDRGMFPLRGFIPVERDGLLGAARNIGVSSIANSALRLHGQMMLSGQASATIAAIALKNKLSPRDLAAEPSRVKEVQFLLAEGVGGPGVLIWPYHDLPPDDEAFVAANLLSVWGIWTPGKDSIDFGAEEKINAKEWEALRSQLSNVERDRLPATVPPTRAAALRAVWQAVGFAR